MSLIIDAIKKAQQLRLKELKGTPFLKRYGSNGKKGESRKKWVIFSSIIGSGVLLTLLLLFRGNILLAPFVPSLMEKGKPSGPQEIRNSTPEPPQKEAPTVRIEKKLSSEAFSIEVKEETPITKKSKAPSPFLPDAVSSGERAIKPKDGPLPASPSEQPSRLKAEAVSNPVSEEKEGEKSRPLPSDALIHFNQGVEFYRKREILKAIQAYEKVIQLDHSYIEAYNNLGVIYQEIGNFDKALEIYQKGLEMNPRYEKILNNLGILFFLEGRHKESGEAFHKALAINPKNVESHINLGILFKKQGQLDRAIESYQKALFLNPLNGETHYNIGLLYEQLENLDLAIQHYQSFIQLSLKAHPDLAGKVQRHLNYLMRVRGDKEK